MRKASPITTKRAAVIVVGALVAVTVSLTASGAAAGSGCRFVVGKLQETQVEGEGFQARGRLTGGIQGTDNFTLLTLSETHEDTPTVSHFVGRSLIETLRGDIETIVAGAFDLETGRFSDLLTIVGGTGTWENATGQIHLFGSFDFTTQTGRSEYRGEICTA
jgi:hypothetical protein